MNVIAEMGSGKTLFATLYAIDYIERTKDCKVFANYKIDNLKNFVYTPLLFLPFSDLKNCLIIADDFYSLDILKSYSGVIVNISRKRYIDMILTCQYYTMIPLQLRTLGYNVFPNFDQKNDILYIKVFKGNRLICEKMVKEAVKRAKKYYNTNEVVEFATEKKVISEIKKISKDFDDLERNISIYTKSRTEQKRLMKILANMS